LVGEQAGRSPDAVAVIDEYESICYAELDRRAVACASHLRQLGVGVDDIVGVCAERSVGMVVALLGVLKAGAAYLPLDPDLPRERLAFMADDSQAPVILVQPRFASCF